MSDRKASAVPSRREFLKNTGTAAAAVTIAGMVVPSVHAAEDNTIRVCLVGCGGRGRGAAGDCLGAKTMPTKLVALADVFPEKIEDGHRQLTRDFGDRVDVPRERQYIGFDAYKHAMDNLRPGDIAIFATPLAFRWVHFTYAIEKGLNVFMEKPLTADGASSRKMLKLAEDANAKNLKVGVGLMSRHSRPMQQLADRIKGGEIGEIVMLRGYRMHEPLASMASTAKPADQSEVAFQIRRFHSFLWASGGCFSDFYIHLIDHCCWMKGAWPVEAQAIGGRHYREDPIHHQKYIDQNFDTYGVEYTFADGGKFFFDGRCMIGCKDIYRSFAHGTKGVAQISAGGDCNPPSAIFKGLSTTDKAWESKQIPGETNPYHNEWVDLLQAIRDDKPYSEVKRGVEASLTGSMGRMAAHTGQIITFDQMLNSKHEFAPNVDTITMDGPAPVMPGSDGKYPVPQPGIVTTQEYKA